MPTKRGKLVVIYGINNLGKSTQAKRLVEKLNQAGTKSEYLKYPIYDLEPTGPLINGYLRQGNPFNLNPTELQLLYALNRTQYQSNLTDKLNQGITIVAEDYFGTGIAWGIGSGVNPEFLKLINSHTLLPDLTFLFEGERFMAGKEKNHAHENNDSLMDKVKITHQQLGKEYGWISVDANRSREVIAQEVWGIVKSVIK